MGAFISEGFELYKTGNYSRKDLEKLGLAKGISWEAEERVFDENGGRKVALTTKHVTAKMFETILVNPVYCQCRRIDGKIIKVENAKWPALTSYETFMACQKVKGIRAMQSHAKAAVRYPQAADAANEMPNMQSCRDRRGETQGFGEDVCILSLC